MPKKKKKRMNNLHGRFILWTKGAFSPGPMRNERVIQRKTLFRLCANDVVFVAFSFVFESLEDGEQYKTEN